MKDKDLIKNLKKLKETPVRREFLMSLQGDLKKYMEFYPVREGIRIKASETAPFFRIPILKTTALALIMVLALGVAGAVFASQKSLPGDVLYPVKILTESLQETLTFDVQKKALLQTRLTEKRIEEIEDVLEEIVDELNNIEKEIEDEEIADEVVEEAEEEEEEEEEKDETLENDEDEEEELDDDDDDDD